MLGFVSMLTDVASEMIVPLLPVFLIVLSAGPFALGWIEGVADAIASILKLFSGKWADRMGRNRPLVIAGYMLSALSRPFIALAGTAWHVMVIRSADRVGKGLRSSPRDALIAASVAPSERGAAFSLNRAMDHTGAVLGALCAAAFLAWVYTEPEDLRWLFACAAIPGAAAVIVVIFCVREAPPAAATTGASPATPSITVQDDHESARQHGRLLRVLLPLGLFTLSRASDAFLLLKALEEGAPLVALPLLWAAFHIVKTVASVPGGKLADRWGKRRTIALGWIMFIGIYAGMAFVDGEWTWALFLLYGAHYGLTEGPEKALVADMSHAKRRGTAFGWYHGVLGILTLAASGLFGTLWQAFDGRTAFLTSAGVAAAALVCLWLISPRAVSQAQATATAA